jgi:hypothetical protein
LGIDRLDDGGGAAALVGRHAGADVGRGLGGCVVEEFGDVAQGAVGVGELGFSDAKIGLVGADALQGAAD